MTAGGAPGPIQRVVPGDPAYPPALGDLERPPAELFALGRLDVVGGGSRAAVAIVGTRDASPYGVRIARELARAVVRSGGVVVSGLARGVDAAAHEAALDAGGDTVAVLGTGVDVPYPVGHRSLHARIAGAGLVLSEAQPGSKAMPGCFPRRNRIIAALARVTVVVEAGFQSGALNTAGQADEIGRLVAAVPGPIDSPRSSGANQLIRDGGHPITTLADLLSLAKLSQNATVHTDCQDAGDTTIWDALGGGEMDADELARITGMSVRSVLAGLSRLEARGIVSDTGGGRMARVGLFPASPRRILGRRRVGPPASAADQNIA